MSPPSSSSMISLAQVLVGQPLARGPARVARGIERAEELLVEEVGEWSVTDIVEEAGDPERLDDEALGRQRLVGRRDRDLGAERRVERSAPQPGLVHDAQAVGEPRVLGGREHPAGALELADPPEPLDPRAVKEIVLRDVLVGQPGLGGVLVREVLGQLEIAVDRVTDQVDRTERVATGHRAPA